MFQSSLRASRSAVLRVARQQQATLSRRTLIIPTAVRQAELVQDMYLRELKNYKQPTVKATDSEGHVQKFTMPKPPTSPEEGDIANELKAYESQQVEVEGQSSTGAPPVEEDWFEEEPEEEAAGHH
ncbi:hypothetical protein NA57DRAFT_57884 [Rhizodiscina lignyota]|uniref:Mitochondrial F1F0 ATP synthase subunit Atp14 n=1 Tax=Rhizodiscina lignyota TaxID=1504668 RepID=A0A9P4IEZ2_9PEZI|nr:hypothetical protein NA57DRAFT_57884 [Rhizodiscina lignyota]